jgi:hypothetical protein
MVDCVSRCILSTSPTSWGTPLDFKSRGVRQWGKWVSSSVFSEWEKPTPRANAWPMHDSKFWKECHLLAPIVGFSHSERTLVSRAALMWLGTAAPVVKAVPSSQFHKWYYNQYSLISLSITSLSGYLLAVGFRFFTVVSFVLVK